MNFACRFIKILLLASIAAGAWFQEKFLAHVPAHLQSNSLCRCKNRRTAGSLSNPMARAYA